MDVADYYTRLARWLELRATAEELHAQATEARKELDRFCGHNFPEMHRERDRLVAQGHKLVPIGRLEIFPQDPARLRRGAEFYRGEAERLMGNSDCRD